MNKIGIIGTGLKGTSLLTGKEIKFDLHGVAASVLRPKDGYELLAFLKENKRCEIVNTHAFLAAKALEDNKCGFSFSFKKSRWNDGWAGFEKS
jgi:hypothetical protein